MNPLFQLIRRFSIDVGYHFLKQTEHTFDGVLKTAKFIKLENGHCLVEFNPSVDHANRMNVIHGGFLTTAIESFTTYALVTHQDCGYVESVSTDTHICYLKSIKVGQVIVFDCKTNKVGKNVAFTECLITDKNTGELLVKGNHTKFLRRDKQICV